MPLRFHESLPALVRAATAAGVAFDRETIVVRDGAGRLVLGRETVPEHGRVEAALRAALGGYAGNVVLIAESTVRRLLMDPTVSEVEIDIGDEQPRVVRYADRRIVGMDWLRAPIAPGG